MGGTGIDLELWRARVGMFHAARCRGRRRGKGGRIPLVQICLLALAVGMMVSLTPAVLNMLLLLGGDIELNPGPGFLHLAAIRGEVNVIRHWVNTNRSLLNVRDECNNTLFHYAALHGHLDIIRMLINFGCDASIKGWRGWTPLHFACKGGHSNVVQMLLSKRSYNLMSVDDNGNLPIHIAATFGHWDIIQMLATDFGCDINIAGEHGWTALHYACQGGHISTVKKLIHELNCYPNKKNSKHGSTPIHIAALYGELDIVRLLVEEFGCNVNSRNEQGRMPLHAASAGGHSETVSVLILQFGCNPMSKDGCGYTPLHHAAEIGHVETVSMLVSEYGCNPIDKNDSGNTPLHIACMKGHCDIIKFFVSECGCSPSVRGHNGMTCMHSACQGGHVEAISMLISVFGYDPIYKDDHGNLPVYTAAKNGHSNVVKLLLNEFSCDINSVGGYKRTLLHGACLSGNVDTVRMLISEFGCDPMAEDFYSIMPLHLSAVKGHDNVLKLLVRDYDCNVNAKGWKGRSTLHFACEQGHSKTVHMLISEFGCDPMGKDKYGNTSLHIATKDGQMDIITLLISEYGCSVNARGRNGMTPLHMSCCCNQMASAKLLLSKFHCNAEAKDNFGNTPLHVACRNKVVNVVHMLISEFNVNTSAINDSSLSPLDIAASVGSNEVIKELTGHMDIKGHPSVLQYALKNEHWDTVCMLIEEFSLDPSGNWDSHTSTPLHLACKKKDLEMVHKLIKEYCVKTMAVDQNLLTPFEIAVETSDKRIVKEFIGHVDMDKDTQYWLLRRAYTSGHSDVFKTLIFNFHCNPNTVTDHNDSILRDVSEKKDWDMVHLLITELNCNPCINYDDWECSTPLHLACQNKDVDMAHKLISDFGVNTLVWDENGDSPLEVAIDSGDMRIIKEFVGHTNMDDFNQYLLLHRAYMSGHWDTFQVLISDFGCDPNTVPDDGYSILHDACKNKDLDMVHKLISDFDVHTLTYNEIGDTPLQIAIETGDMRIVKEFIGHTDMDNYEQYCCLSWACMSGHWDMLRVLTSDFGCDTNTVTDDGDSILHDACVKKDWDMVRLLITEFGCDPNINPEFCSWEDSYTPLHLACKNKDLVMVHKLIYDFDVITMFWVTNGGTALHIAIETGDMRIVKEFIGHADMDNDDQYSHLRCACMSGHWDILRVLISDFGCDPNTVTDDGDSILRDACVKKDWDMVHLLIIEFGCNRPSRANVEHWEDLSTPIHLAIENSDLSMVCKLIQDFGVDVYDENGDSPLDLASRIGSINIVKEFIGYINTENHSSALLYACENGHMDVARMLITDLGFDPMGSKYHGFPLHHACMRETNLDTVLMLISEFDVNINDKNYDGETAVDIAIASGCIDIVKMLLNHTDISSSQLQKGLFNASSNGHLEMVEFLITDLGADPFARSISNDMAIHGAAEHGKVEVVSAMINKFNCNPAAEGHLRRTPLHHACVGGSYDLFNLLVSITDLDVQCKDVDDNTPMHIAAMHGRAEMVKDLTQMYGASTYCLNNKLQTPLHLALVNKHKQIADMLVSECNSQIIDVAGNSPLHLAAMCGCADMVSKLIQQYQSSPDCLNSKHQTPLHLALEEKHEEIADMLLSKFLCCPTSADIDGNTPLHVAVQYGLQGIVRKLQNQYKSIPDCRNNKQETPLFLAAKAKNWTIVDILVSKFGCCPMKANDTGSTPLHYAAMYGPTEINRKIIKQCQSTLDCMNNRRETPLLLAAKEKNWKIVDILLSEYGCCPMKANIDGNTPLYYAASHGPSGINRKIIEQYKSTPDCMKSRQEAHLFLAAEGKNWSVVDILLSEFCCSPKAVDAEENTLLHIAAKNGNADLVTTLLSEYKVSSSPQNSSGHTPLYYATLNRHTRIVSELVKHNCNPAAFDDDYKALEEISHRKLSEGSLTKVFVIGNKCAGKSTLIEALKNEAQFDPYFSNKVTPHTAGIIPSIHHSKQYGRVLFYDFAGHPEYYSSHAAALEKLLSSSCHVFLLVVDFSDLEESILYTLRYWLTFISYNSKDLHPISQVIIVGSHADVIEVKGEDAERKVCELFTEISSEVCSQHPYTEMVGYCSLDCRQSDSIGIGNLYNLLKHCCISFPVDESRQLSVGAMLLLGVLQRDFKGILACEVSQICAHIQLTDIYLPQGLVSIYSYLQELNAQGVVLILGNHEDLKEEWVILDVSTFLATVHKKLFSSTSLFHICNRKSLSNLGIIPESDLKNVLQEFDTKLLKQCLKHLQYCIELNDSEVLHKIFQDTCITSIETATNAPESVDNDKTVKTSDKGGDTPAAGSSSSKLLFFPALLSDTERTDINWYRKQEHASCKGWYIRCTCEYDYFPTRFIHVLLLRLAFNFALPPCNVRKQKTPKILDLCSRRCTMWKNGIHWLMKTEVECVVEVVNGSKGVIVMVRSKKEFDVDCACLYQNVINEVLKARQHFCHSLAAEAYLIHPNDLNQNCIPSITSLHLFDMHEVKEALTENQNAVISVCGKETLPLSCLQIHSMWNSLFPEALSTCDILRCIYSVVSEWFRLGLELRVPASTLEAIEYDHRGDVETCRRKMVQEWLKQPCSSWCSLIEALKRVGLERVADEISSECLKTKELKQILLNRDNSDSEVTKEFVKNFALVLGSMWPLLASLLSFTTAEIEQIKKEVTGAPSVKAAAMMNRWRERVTATYGILMTKLTSVLGEVLPDQVAAKTLHPPKDSPSNEAHKRRVSQFSYQPVGKKRTPDTYWRQSMQEESPTCAADLTGKRKHPSDHSDSGTTTKKVHTESN